MGSIKTYLAKFTIFDGEHEYNGQFLVKANSSEEAEAIAESQEHEPEYPAEEENRTYWDYGDATTKAGLGWVTEITEEEAAMLERLGVASYFN